jgi:DNA-directed RNA polymerase subunit RPC12/RpoP
MIFWPLIGFETQDTFDDEDVKADSTIKYVGEITDIGEFAGIYVLELDHGTLEAFSESENFEVNDQVVVTIEYGGNISNWDENTYTVEKIPTMGGIYGALFLFVGLVMCIAGIVTKKADILEAVEFSLKPPSQLPAKGNEPSAGTSQPGPVQQGMGDEVTCPKCGRIFPVPGTTRPMMIKCPECGVEGVLK